MFFKSFNVASGGHRLGNATFSDDHHAHGGIIEQSRSGVYVEFVLFGDLVKGSPLLLLSNLCAST